MGISYQYACDGCRAKKNAETPELPFAWAMVTVAISQDGGGPVSQTHLLCESCRAEIVRKSDPKQWSRARDCAELTAARMPS